MPDVPSLLAPACGLLCVAVGLVALVARRAHRRGAVAFALYAVPFGAALVVEGLGGDRGGRVAALLAIASGGVVTFALTFPDDHRLVRTAPGLRLLPAALGVLGGGAALAAPGSFSLLRFTVPLAASWVAAVLLLDRARGAQDDPSLSGGARRSALRLAFLGVILHPALQTWRQYPSFWRREGFPFWARFHGSQEAYLAFLVVAALAVLVTYPGTGFLAAKAPPGERAGWRWVLAALAALVALGWVDALTRTRFAEATGLIPLVQLAGVVLVGVAVLRRDRSEATGPGRGSGSRDAPAGTG